MVKTQEAQPASPTILATLTAKLVDGDLPVLRKTAGHIVTLASSTRSDIGMMAQTILQDQAFAARVLRMANSVYYNRSASGKVSTVTRAVLLLGYGTIRDIALASEYADFAQLRIPAYVDLQRIIAKAFVAANQAVELGAAIGLPHAEELFTSALLHSLGELAMAYCLPETYAQIRERMAETSQTYTQAHRTVLGVLPDDVNSLLAQRYNIPSTVLGPLETPADPSRWTQDDRKSGVIQAAADLVDNLFAPPSHAAAAAQFNALVAKCTTTLKTDAASVVGAMKDAFKKSCALGNLLGLDPSKFEPMLAAVCDPAPSLRGTVIQDCSSVVDATTSERSDPAPSEASDGPAPITAAQEAAAPVEPLYTSFLMELSAHILGAPDFNTIATYLMEGLHRGVGFGRVALVILHPVSKMIVARIGIGPGVDEHLSAFASPPDPKTNLLMQAMNQKSPLQFMATGRLPAPLPAAIVETLRPVGVALGPLMIGTRSVGLIWADCPKAIPASMWSAFQLFLMQANIGLSRLAK